MRRAFLLCTILLAFLVPHTGFAQPVKEDTAVIEYETYSDTVPVASPYVLVGLMAAFDERADLRRITVFVPPRTPGTLCIDFVSDDGDVEGRAVIANPRPGKRTILLTGVLAERLRQYGAGRLAALAHLSQSCSGSRGLVLPAGWGQETSPHQIRVLLNPTGADTVSLGFGRDSIPCVRLEDPLKVAYEYTCRVNASTLTGHHTFNIRVDCMIGPQPPAIPVRIWLPDGS